MADLKELFSRLGSGASGNQSQHSFQQPSVSSPIFSPSPAGRQPQYQGAIMSPNASAANTPAIEHGPASQQTPQQQSTNLLNLLRFNQPSAGQVRRASQNASFSDGTSSLDRSATASDPAASFIGSRNISSLPSATTPPPAQMGSVSTTSGNPQDLLLRLLNHPKPAQSDDRSSRVSATASPAITTDKPVAVADDLVQDPAELEKVSRKPAAGAAAPSTRPKEAFGFNTSLGPSSQFQPEVTSQPLKFTYVNPFEQLAATIPRNPTPNSDKTKAAAPRMEILKSLRSVETPGATAADIKDKKIINVQESVPQVASNLGGPVKHQTKDTSVGPESEPATRATNEPDKIHAEDIAEMQEAIVDVATEVKEALDHLHGAQHTETSLPNPLAKALKTVATEIVDGSVIEDWETAEAKQNVAKSEGQTVIVYRFPMRAFSTITVNRIPSQRLSFPPELFMDIARLKKDFDQVDRCLVAASKTFIVYALVKKGGFRIIRQENGHYRQVFENHQERIFNIALCTSGDESPQISLESILGVGVNGTVFWTSLDPTREDQFGENLDSQGLVLPPIPSQDDSTSGGPLKTRAKPSSRHPEFFAVGRGKSIHIVFPKVAAEYTRGKSRVCQTEKYFKERSLRIVTGKAGKDFIFSEDDTVVVSLDKAGRVRFWDIRALTEPELGNPRDPPRQVEVSETLLEFHTTAPSAKSWPTSVFFFDKDKPYTKGIALRYVMVGMKQNHAFQLWDLGLGKAVQEIYLPHEKESDAICSVYFHPKTGIMAVAHPTNNSIFFVHVSCPRYNLPVMSQAAYISRLANKDEKGYNPLPAVNATAIMTSITEYSFASKGQIRSVHMLNEAAGPIDSDDINNVALFELYVMHSRGVCILRVRRSDLGWKKDGEPINPKEAEQEGVISIAQLKPPSVVTDESSTAGDTPVLSKSVSDRSIRETVKSENIGVLKQSSIPEAALRTSALAEAENKQDATRATNINGSGGRSEKKKKKRLLAETTSQAPASLPSSVRPPQSYAQAVQAAPPLKSPALSDAPSESENVKSATVPDPEGLERSKRLANKNALEQASSSTPMPAAEWENGKLEALVQAGIAEGFTRELDILYKRLEEDKRVMNAANGAKQEAILRLVSSTLTENVEGVIRKMVNENVRNVLLPEVVARTTATLEQSVASNLKSALNSQLSKEIPDAVSRALGHHQFSQSLSDQVAEKLNGTLRPGVVATMESVLNPAIAGLSTSIEQQISGQIRQALARRQEDAAEIAKLTDTVHTCLETIQTLAVNQADFQSQISKLQQSLAQHSAQAPSYPPPETTHFVRQKTPEELETEAITQLMANGSYEQGTMQWLQSSRNSELFDSVFVRFDPAFLSQVSPLLALSAGAVVSDSLQSNLPERLAWLDAVLGSFNPHDIEIRDIVPKIMDIIKQRLTTTYIQLNESTSMPNNPLLRRISALVDKCKEMAYAASPLSPRH